ncbi:MAG: TetR/AcrR family transcriptional regulator [Sphaerochaeta sp.]|nr:TetR/AcrR family transcriptional regulator [Sphaerochaeta sp.]
MNYVHFEIAMKTQHISQEAILSVAKEIVSRSGINALNIRTIAQRCSISVGSVYNYFPSKGDLVIATIGSIWREILFDSKSSQPKLGFIENIQWLFDKIHKGSETYPSFFSVHPMSLANVYKKTGRDVMHQYFLYMKQGLLTALEQDPYVKKDVFSDTFTQVSFVDFVFSNILTLLTNGKKSCTYLSEIVRHILY